MSHQHLIANPFALMMTPDAVFAAMEQSDRLSRLKSRIWRPLDGPRTAQAANEVSAFDDDVEATADVAGSAAADMLEWPVLHAD